MKTVIVIQARTGSSRLPNKVLLPLAGRPLLQRMIERVQASSAYAEIVVATTYAQSDAPIADLARSMGVPVYKGHPLDLLDRHYRAAHLALADAVVKIPSDCPLIDPAIIDRVVGRFHSRSNEIDYVSNLHPQSYPDGNDVEVMSMEVLSHTWREANLPHEREHTTPYIWDHPEWFALDNVLWETGQDYSMTHRWTIDYPEDYAFISKIYNYLWSPATVFSLSDILHLLKEKPELMKINSRYAGVNWYRHHLHRLRTVTERETRPEPQSLSGPAA